MSRIPSRMEILFLIKKYNQYSDDHGMTDKIKVSNMSDDDRRRVAALDARVAALQNSHDRLPIFKSGERAKTWLDDMMKMEMKDQSMLNFPWDGAENIFRELYESSKSQRKTVDKEKLKRIAATEEAKRAEDKKAREKADTNVADSAKREEKRKHGAKANPMENMLKWMRKDGEAKLVKPEKQKGKSSQAPLALDNVKDDRRYLAPSPPRHASPRRASPRLSTPQNDRHHHGERKSPQKIPITPARTPPRPSTPQNTRPKHDEARIPQKVRQSETQQTKQTTPPSPATPKAVASPKGILKKRSEESVLKTYMPGVTHAEGKKGEVVNNYGSKDGVLQDAFNRAQELHSEVRKY
ncbi:uncharacterized protein LY89DRAFT_721782 [Mollisia scopiformis]|uniref:Uncharacterized protein n=1 Tax=Mollisia scopiformis TaxID=149040 RepID=A0A194WZ40_MOLSC|nr:uncharacterized protein LY89DRAFT_721782 [Mollisia scopiformis]KUJ12969.1 hypothetical protein LY89DRAFT_721782 [Mollisia scopiformis]